jgi:hypothetical protein
MASDDEFDSDRPDIVGILAAVIFGLCILGAIWLFAVRVPDYSAEPLPPTPERAPEAPLAPPAMQP